MKTWLLLLRKCILLWCTMKSFRGKLSQASTLKSKEKKKTALTILLLSNASQWVNTQDNDMHSGGEVEGVRVWLADPDSCCSPTWWAGKSTPPCLRHTAPLTPFCAVTLVSTTPSCSQMPHGKPGRGHSRSSPTRQEGHVKTLLWGLRPLPQL